MSHYLRRKNTRQRGWAKKFKFKIAVVAPGMAGNGHALPSSGSNIDSGVPVVT